MPHQDTKGQDGVTPATVSFSDRDAHDEAAPGSPPPEILDAEVVDDQSVEALRREDVDRAQEAAVTQNGPHMAQPTTYESASHAPADAASAPPAATSSSTDSPVDATPVDEDEVFVGTATVDPAPASKSAAGRPSDASAPDATPDTSAPEATSDAPEAASDTSAPDASGMYVAEAASDESVAPSDLSVADEATSDGPVDAASGELSPGDVPVAPVAELWPDAAAENLRQRWRDLQLRFVDDPQGAAAEADFLVGEAIETLTGALAAQRTDLAGWRSAGDGDTEQLRVAVQRYREFLDRILGL